MTDLVFLTASQLAKAILMRELSAVEVLEAHLEQVSRHNHKLNALVTLNDDAARQRAREADAALARGEVWGPLHGVPVTIKDAFETAGLRTTSSYKPLANYVPQQDAAVVARLRAAGAIILGKTNMPALAGDYQSDSRLFGRANNPWDLTRTPGGSTGGGAAAVAAGLSPLEIGSDAGGSLRIPAHFTGVFGFKPTQHRVSGVGHIPPLPGSPKTRRHLMSFGPLARCVEDLSLCLSVVAAPDARGGGQWPIPLDVPQRKHLRERRFAWTDGFGGIPTTAETRSALEKLATELVRLGCRVERRNPEGFDFDRALRTWGEIYATERHAWSPVLGRLMMLLGTTAVAARSPFTRGFSSGLRLNAGSYLRALEQRDILAGKLDRFLADWDAWICPVASVPAFRHRKAWELGSPLLVDGRRVSYEMAAGAYAAVFSLTGNPVVVLPLARSEDGLPIGLQLVGRCWRDMGLLAVAEQMSTEVTGPFRRPPGY